MKRNIYVRLLDEGTRAFRPVHATEIKSDVFEIDATNAYNTDDEIWEFPPGTRVFVQTQFLDGELELVAVSEYKGSI